MFTPETAPDLQSMNTANSRQLAYLLSTAHFEIFPNQTALDQVASLPLTTPLSLVSSPRRLPEFSYHFAEPLVAGGRQIIIHQATRSIRDIDHYLDLYKLSQSLGIDHWLLVGGDNSNPAGQFAFTGQLLEAIDRYQLPVVSHLDIPGYPQGHPSISPSDVSQSLSNKARFILAHNCTSEIISQISPASSILTWLDELNARQYHLPVRIGVPGVVDIERLDRFTQDLCVETKELIASSIDPLAPDIFNPITLLLDCVQRSSPTYSISGLHFFTFNHIQTTQRWLDNTLQSLS